MTPELYKKISMGRRYAITALPWIADLVDRLVFVESKAVPTLAIGADWVVQVNPDYVKDFDHARMAASILHETGHNLERHGDRFEAARIPHSMHHLWNLCGDAEWNNWLREFEKSPSNKGKLDGVGLEIEVAPLITVPKNWIFPESLDCKPGLTAEEMFAECLTRKTQPSGGGGEGQGDCGGACHSPTGKQDHPDGVTADEADAMLRTAAMKAEDWESSGRGIAPGNLKRLAKLLKTPVVVPWYKVLQRRIGRALSKAAGQRDFSKKRESRREGVDRYTPRHGMVGVKASVAVVFDTSGSMGERDLGKGMKELSGAIKLADKVFLIPTDSEPHKVVHVRSIERACDELVGGGGTDMGAGLRKAGEVKASLTVVITDGDTDWPGTKPEGNKDVIIVLTRKQGHYPGPAWASEVIDASGSFDGQG